MNLLLDVERRRVDDEIGPVLLVLAAPCELRIRDVDVALGGGFFDLIVGQANACSFPYKLRVEVLVARTLRSLRQSVAALVHHRLNRSKFLGALRGGLQLGSRNVPPLRLPVRQHFDLFRRTAGFLSSLAH
jgi:hypothetical protein